MRMWGAVVAVPHVERRSELGIEASGSKCGVSSASNHGRTVDQSLQRSSAGLE
ncbi:hypothetical protein IG631_10823 [Alternaria alternata]|nr:hypothetical protein IG631_10823 [Alternaria alternata]